VSLRPELLDAVAAALPGPAEPGLQACDVHRRMGQWSLRTVRLALSDLAKAGRVSWLPKNRDGTVRLYRRAAQ
jgi:hypothetical protein